MESKMFGCKVNNYYLNQRLNYFDNIGEKDGYLIATCVVTHRAKKKFVKEVIQNINKGKKIYLTGCATISKGDKISQNKFFKYYPELQDFQDQITLLPESPPQTSTNQNTESKTRGLSIRKPVIIQTGCDSNCTFCLTIKSRGSHKSIPEKQIINQINNYHKSGIQEIVLTGINLASWGCTNTTKPKENQFSYLLQKILQNTSIPRIRISSIGPEFIDDKFFEIIKNPRFMTHFHFSIQSFSDKILKMMNRNYTIKTLDYVLTNTRNTFGNKQGNISIGADIIVGFPGETQEDFQETLNGIINYKITKLHIFPFSSHQYGQQVPASNFPNQISQFIKKQREKELIKIGNNIRENFTKTQQNQKHNILIESEKDGIFQGRTENYIQHKKKGNHGIGDIIKLSNL